MLTILIISNVFILKETFLFIKILTQHWVYLLQNCMVCATVIIVFTNYYNTNIYHYSNIYEFKETVENQRIRTYLQNKYRLFSKNYNYKILLFVFL